jgi:hypothetical protein
MPVYIVGYDPNNPGKDYDELIEAIKGYGTWWHHLDSTWLIVTDQSTAEIRDYVGQFMDQNDELLVVKLAGAWATRGIKKSGNDWLHQHM